MKITHVRRCHVCGTVCESENAVTLKCDKCGKYWAPFYFFDEHLLDGLSETGAYFSVWKKAEQYNPIWGLSLYWQEEYESHTPRC